MIGKEKNNPRVKLQPSQPSPLFRPKIQETSHGCPFHHHLLTATIINATDWQRLQIHNVCNMVLKHTTIIPPVSWSCTRFLWIYTSLSNCCYIYFVLLIVVKSITL